MEASTYPDAKVIAASKNFVNVISHSETSHGTKKVIVGREIQEWCKEYWGITCDVHVEGSKASGNFFKGSYGTPTTVFCDPEGKELARYPGGLGSGDLVKKMNEVLAKVPGAKISATEWTGAKKSVALVDELIGKEEYKKAVAEATKLAKNRNDALAKMGADAVAKLEEKGNALIEQAKGMMDSDAEGAKRLLRQVSSDFKGLECAKTAAELLKG